MNIFALRCMYCSLECGIYISICHTIAETPVVFSRYTLMSARTAFDAALGRELHEVMQQAKKMISQIQQSSDLWDLEHYLTQRRKEIDRTYDFRYSELTQ